MYKIKQNYIYKLEYDIKLNNGLINKSNTELKSIKNKINLLKILKILPIINY